MDAAQPYTRFKVVETVPLGADIHVNAELVRHQPGPHILSIHPRLQRRIRDFPVPRRPPLDSSAGSLGTATMHYGVGMRGVYTHRRRRGNHTPAAGWHVSSVGATGGLGADELHTAVPARRALVVVEASWAVAAEAMAAEFLAVEAVEVALLAALPRLEAAFASHPLKFVSDVGGGWSVGLTSRHCCCYQFRCRCQLRNLRSLLLPPCPFPLEALQLEPIISMLTTFPAVKTHLMHPLQV